MKPTYFIKASFLAVMAGVLFLQGARADSAAELDRKGRLALWDLYEKNPKALQIAKKANAVLVFPSIVKAGFMIGVQRGDGVLIGSQGSIGYYNTSSVSYGFQAGVQQYGYALFFLDAQSLGYLNRSEGWDIGSAPSLVIADKGMSGSMSVMNMNKGIVAFFFDQKGLMGGLGFQGTKITPYTPSE